jgi:hypothetical protein
LARYGEVTGHPKARPTPAKPLGDHTPLGGFVDFSLRSTNRNDCEGPRLPLHAPTDQSLGGSLAFVDGHHSATLDRLLWGRVWRRHDGRHWIYKKFVEYDAQ